MDLCCTYIYKYEISASKTKGKRIKVRNERKQRKCNKEKVR